MKKLIGKLLVYLILGVILLWPFDLRAGYQWEQVGGNGFGDPTNSGVVDMEVWNGTIYAGIIRPNDSGARIYSSITGTNWTQAAIADGFGHAALNAIVDFQSFNGRLYATATDDKAVPTGIGEIWSTADGTNWAQSGAAGLGNANNRGFYKMEVFGGWLYAGSRNSVNGAELLRTQDGTNWAQANIDGFGSVNNVIIWGLKSFGGWLWAGTANANGAQVWRSTDGATWVKYFDYATTNPPQPGYTIVNNFHVFNNTLYWAAVSAAPGVGGHIIMREASDVRLQVSMPGLGDNNNDLIGQNAVNVGSLVYFGTRNGVTGGELWISWDGLNAIQIGQDGFGNVDNFALYALVWKDNLYVAFSNVNPATGLQMFRIAITADFLIMTNKNLPNGEQGGLYSAPMTTAGGKSPYYWKISSGSLPKGLTVNDQTGEIAGTPEESGDFQFQLRVQDGRRPALMAYKTFNLEISSKDKAVAGESISNIKILPKTGADLY